MLSTGAGFTTADVPAETPSLSKGSILRVFLALSHSSRLSTYLTTLNTAFFGADRGELSTFHILPPLGPAKDGDLPILHILLSLNLAVYSSTLATTFLGAYGVKVTALGIFLALNLAKKGHSFFPFVCNLFTNTIILLGMDDGVLLIKKTFSRTMLTA